MINVIIIFINPQNDIEENISDQRYTIKEIEVSGKKASVYLDSENKPACVDIADSNMQGFSCKLYSNRS